MADAPRKRSGEPAGLAPTLGQLHDAGPKWLWLYCQAPGRYHHAPAAIAPFVIRWGPEASSDMLRHSARRWACGAKAQQRCG
jgi:hypothetical protein